ncbi:MAG: hypothetical protein WCN92_02565 [Eubacteriales bacterium]
MKNKKAFAISASVIVIAIAATIAVFFVIAAGRPTAIGGSVYKDSLLLQSFYDYPQSISRILPTTYGLTDEQSKSVLNDKGEWNAYTLDVAVNNKSKDNITLYTFEVKNNGKNDVWISKVANNSAGIVSGNIETISISVLVKGKDVSAETAAAAIKKYSIKIGYSKTPTKNSQGVESIEKHKIINVK